MVECDSCGDVFHNKCLDPPLKKKPAHWFCNNCLVGNGFYGFKDDTRKFTLGEFERECAQFDDALFPYGKPALTAMEALFWSTVCDEKNPLSVRYGADIHNSEPGQVSGFPTAEYRPDGYSVGDRVDTMKHESEVKSESADMQDALLKRATEYDNLVKHPMNLNNLPGNPKSLLSMFGKNISGVTVPWVYVGSTFSTFCWHLEDQYTLSANYQHLGATKKWYSVPPASVDQFNAYMKFMAPDLFLKQPDLIHQLVTLVSPYDIPEDIVIYTANQEPGEYVVTFPKCYHCGFNSGFNVNEAVNFTIMKWVPYGVEALNEYKTTGKSCVFDMYELMLSVLITYLENGENTDVDIVQSCMAEVLAKMNSEIKIVTKLESWNMRFERHDMPSRRQYGDYIPEILPVYSRKDEEIQCDNCKTFCSFAYVAHTQKHRQKQVLCLQDYFDMDTPGADRDLLIFIRDYEQVRNILDQAKRKLEKQIR